MYKNMNEEIIKSLKESKSKRKWNEVIMAEGIKNEEENIKDKENVKKIDKEIKKAGKSKHLE